MKLGVVLPTGAPAEEFRELAVLSEVLGFDSVWSGESYGADALTPLAWAGSATSRVRLGTSIMQVAARTPAATAMAARSMYQLSAGRFVLGLGLSGPAVVEDWHGQPFGPSPLRRLGEYVTIVRTALAGDRVEFDGRDYRVPNPSSGRVEEARALRPLVPGGVDVPIMLAALGPKSAALASSIADGWLSVFFSPRYWRDVYDGQLVNRAASGFEVVSSVAVAVGDDLAQCFDDLRPEIAFYIGAMGTKKRNFYFDLVCGYGYEAVAVKVKERFGAGDRDGAVTAVPDDLVDDLTIAGPPERIRDRLASARKSCHNPGRASTRSHDAARPRTCVDRVRTDGRQANCRIPGASEGFDT